MHDLENRRGRTELAAGAMHVAGGYVVVVDRCHPFAVTLDSDGTVCATATWADLLAPPNAWHHPRRRLLHLNPTSVAVHDIGTAVAARLVIGPGGSLDVDPVALAALTWPTEHYVPLWRAHTPRTPGLGWLIGTDLRETRWSWWAVHPSVQAPVCSADGSILAWAALSDELGVAAVQHTHKRPLELRPRTSLHLFDAHQFPPSRVLPSVPLPETARWAADPQPGSGEDRTQHAGQGQEAPDAVPAARAPAVAATRAATELDARLLVGRGCTDVSVTLPDGPDVRDPRVVLEFRCREHPGRLFRRVDRPVDELGRPGGGLHDLTVILEEDLDAGLLNEVVRRNPDADVLHI